MSTFRLLVFWYLAVLLAGALLNGVAGTLVAQPTRPTTPTSTTSTTRTATTTAPPTVVPLPLFSRLPEP